MVNHLGFGPTKLKGEPDLAELEKLRQHVGYRKLQLEGNMLGKSDPKVYLDLSAVAKGFAVDKLSQRLSSLGFRDHLVEIGGELKAKGSKPGGKTWVVGVEKPTRGRSVQTLVGLDGMAIATSGVYRNFFETGDGVVAHTINPKTGEALASHLVSVSVLDKDCMRADALATAFLVMGEREAPAFAKKQGVAAMFIIKGAASGQWTTLMTDAFRSALIEEL